MTDRFRALYRFGMPRIEPPKPGDLQRMQAEWDIYQYGLKISDPAYIARERAELRAIETKMKQEALEAIAAALEESIRTAKEQIRRLPEDMRDDPPVVCNRLWGQVTEIIGLTADLSRRIVGSGEEDEASLEPLEALADVSDRYIQALYRVGMKPGITRQLWRCALVPDDGRLSMDGLARGDEITGEGATPEEAIRAAIAQVPHDP